MDKKVKGELKLIATRDGKTISEIIRDAVINWLNKYRQ